MFGFNVRDFRRARGWSQEQLAREMGAHGFEMHQTTVAKIENANRPTTVGEAVALASIFDIELEELVSTGITLWHSDWGSLDDQIELAEKDMAELDMQWGRLEADFANARIAAQSAHETLAAVEHSLGGIKARRNALTRRIVHLRELRARHGGDYGRSDGTAAIEEHVVDDAGSQHTRTVQTHTSVLKPPDVRDAIVDKARKNQQKPDGDG